VGALAARSGIASSCSARLRLLVAPDGGWVVLALELGWASAAAQRGRGRDDLAAEVLVLDLIVGELHGIRWAESACAQ
jgi:hypothetical protein